LQTNNQNPNRLIHEKSPYLQQHAYNPVDWFPWGQEALEKAKAENKPIFLSIGYSTCHWCHVMEQECFSDQQVADLLNAAFICIKVDREERPDLDASYMAVCQAMGRSCGWPLNVLMTPKLNPFLATSYIPKYSKPGIIGMMELVPYVVQTWKIQHTQLEIVGADIKDRIASQEKREAKHLDKQILQDTFDKLKLDFDRENGGFGRYPKFPTPHKLLFLLRHYRRTGEKSALEMVETTLNKMRQGGIYDQLGFGFHRYSTDPQWLVPHFEKMLYDQALLALAYDEAFLASGAKRFGLAAQEILDYVIRDLANPQGGFFSGQDADSDGKEGAYYLWTLNEVIEILSPADLTLAVHVYGLKAEGNYVEAGKPSQKNILHIAESLEELAPYEGLTLPELIGRVREIREDLFEARKNRIAPSVDDKVLTDWNGLMIAALAKTGSLLNEPMYVEAAKKTADFLLTQMRKGDLLYHRFAKGEAAIEGFLDDYALLIFGLIELYEATFEEKYLKAADDLAKVMVAKFWDQKNGGFYQITENQTNLPKIKQLYDGAAPSGNSFALHDLVWLGRLTNEPKYDLMANQMVEAFAGEIAENPEAYTYFISQLDFFVGKFFSVVVVGDLKDENTQKMVNTLKTSYLPSTVISLKAPSKTGLDYQQIDEKATAYVCQNQTCLAPTNNLEQIMANLKVKPKETK
jgi:uncharacterized protein